ncbi:hypothetical protein BH20ACT4_BH20ACT4_13540 [soil metagenome]
MPALAEWHEAHSSVIASLEPDDRLPQHAALEVYSVLTRLPAPLRLDPADAADTLRARFPPPYLVLPSDAHDDLVGRLSRAGVRGGSVYDGLVGATASAQGAVLLTRDERATVTYRALGVAHERLR